MIIYRAYLPDNLGARPQAGRASRIIDLASLTNYRNHPRSYFTLKEWIGIIRRMRCVRTRMNGSVDSSVRCFIPAIECPTMSLKRSVEVVASEYLPCKEELRTDE